MITDILRQLSGSIRNHRNLFPARVQNALRQAKRGAKPISIEPLESRTMLSNAYYLEFAVDPTNTKANSAMATVEVQVYNGLGAVSISGVGISLDDGYLSANEKLNGTNAATTDSSGLATFTALNSPDLAQLYDAADGGGFGLEAVETFGLIGGCTNGGSATFTVTAGAPNKLSFSTEPPSSATAGSTLSSVVVQILDAGGNIETGDTSQVTLSPNTGSFASGSTTQVNAVNGVATFSNLKINTAGTYTINASDTDTYNGGSGTIMGASSSVTINPASASKLAFQTIAATNIGVAYDSNLSDPQPIMVDIEDTYGNIVTSANTGTVTLSINSNPGGGALEGTLTATPSAGVAAFNTNWLANTSGNYKLGAAESGLTSAVSNQFTVGSTGASALVFSGTIANSNVGVAYDANFSDPQFINAYVINSSNQIMRNPTGSVTLALGTHPAGAVMEGTASVGISDGVATWESIWLTVSGTYTLTASDTGLTSVTSNNITISAGTAAALIFPGQIANSNLGVAYDGNLSDPQPIVVYVMTSSNQIIRNVSTNVTLAISSNPGGGTLNGTATVALNNGAAVFNTVWLGNTSGSYTLTATDGTLTAPTNNNRFTVGSSGASQLVYATAPVNNTHGVKYDGVGSDPPPIVVYVENASNQIIRNVTSMVTLSVATGPGAIFGTASVALSNGAAIFNTVYLNTAGTYTLTASDGSLTSITSGSFVIS